MKEESLRVQVEGHLLYQLVLHPPGGVPVRAEAVFYHGQGDYAERYLDVLHPFTNSGIRCTITELPGHGRSPGKRGHCGDALLLDAVIWKVLAQIADRGNLPYGVMGHSMGGLLALRHLVLAGQGVFPAPAFAWLSSPLIKPGRGRPAFFIKLVRLLAPLYPSLCFSTRVKPEECRARAGAQPAGQVQPDVATADPLKAELSHKRISLAWGVTLMDFASLVGEGMGDVPATIPLLFTQGGEDPVCPPDIAREVFTRLPGRSKRYEELEGILHEPFRGDGSELLYAVLEHWLEASFGAGGQV